MRAMGLNTEGLNLNPILSIACGHIWVLLYSMVEARLKGEREIRNFFPLSLLIASGLSLRPAPDLRWHKTE